MLFKKNAYLTDGGFETELVFKEGIDLPEFRVVSFGRGRGNASVN